MAKENYETRNLKNYKIATKTDIKELLEQIKELENAINNIDIDLLNAVYYSLKLIDPLGRYFNDDIKDLQRLSQCLIKLEFNYNDYIIKTIGNDYIKPNITELLNSSLTTKDK